MAKMDELVKQMLQQHPDIVLQLEDYPEVFIIPAIVTKDNCTDVGENHIGEVEYQVSDGPAGQRGTSYDVFGWSQVRKAVKEMAQWIA